MRVPDISLAVGSADVDAEDSEPAFRRNSFFEVRVDGTCQSVVDSDVVAEAPRDDER